MPHADPQSSKQKLPCPFCGDRDVRAHFRRSLNVAAGDAWVIECHSCSCELTGFATEQDAWERWNKRAVETPAPQSKFDLAFEIMRQLDSENMDYMRSCAFGYVLRVVRERTAEKAAGECQHDLLKPDTTIEVIDPWKAKCKVCITFFDLPGCPAQKSSDEYQPTCSHGFFRGDCYSENCAYYRGAAKTGDKP